MARTSAFAFKDTAADVREIGRRLGVTTVVEGSVRRDGDRLRIAAQLVSAGDGYHLWSETYERTLSDVFAVQTELATAIAGALPLSGPQAELRRGNGGTSNLEAYQRYLRGRFFWNRRTPDALRQSIAEYEGAIAADPDYAYPYAGLADTYHVLAVFGVTPPTQAYPAVKLAASKALALDPHRTEAYVASACAAFCHDWDRTLAERQFRRALELDPNYALGWYWYAWHLTALGRFDAAVAAVERAIDLEPLGISINAFGGTILLRCGRHERALEQCQYALELDPSFGPALESLGYTYMRAGRYDEALATWYRIQTSPQFRALRRAVVLAESGDADGARRILREEEAKLDPVSPPPGNVSHYFAAVSAATGDLEPAMRWLEAACEQRLFTTCLLQSDPWVKLVGHPRFPALLRRLRLDDTPIGICAAAAARGAGESSRAAAGGARSGPQ